MSGLCGPKKVVKATAQEYKTDEHVLSLEALQDRIRKDHGLPDYSFETGLSEANRAAIFEKNPQTNELTPPYEKPEWLKFVEELTGFFALLLWGGSILCFVGFALKGDIDNLYLGIVLAVVVVVTGCFSYYQDAKSSNLMANFKDMMAQHVDILTPTGTSDKDAKHLVRGDIVLLKPGVKVPADVRLVKSSDLKVNNSPLTGEPDALERDPEPMSEAQLNEKPQEFTNFLFFGTDVENGTGHGLVVRIGDDTYMGQVAQLTMNTETVDTPINREIHHFITIVSGVAIFLGISFFIIGAAMGTDMITNLVFMIGIIVANVPEGLLATVTVCLSLTAKSMASRMVLVKNMEGVETLGSTTAICSDKTGTLTQNIMTFANLIYDGQVWATELVSERHFATCKRSDDTFKIFHHAMALNTTAKFLETDVISAPLFKNSSGPPVISWNVVGDASETAIVRFAQYMAFPTREDARVSAEDTNATQRKAEAAVADIPFSSALKYHMMLRENKENDSHPNTVYLKGAAERILARCDKVYMNGQIEELDGTGHRDTINAHLDSMMEKGRRCLGFAKLSLPAHLYPRGFKFNTKQINFPMGNEGKAVDMPADGADDAAKQAYYDAAAATRLVFIGVACLIDPPRPAVPAAVLSCQTAGIRVVMVTGDHPKTARAIARMVNIIGANSLTEDEVAANNAAQGLTPDDEGWSDPELAPAIVIKGSDISLDTPEERWQYIFAHDEIVFARTSPSQKLLIVKHFQELAHEIVAVTGDGVNDAPALKKADIGVAMNITGTDVAKGAADMILLDDNFASIVAGVEEGRLIFDNLKKSIAYTLSSNIPEISPFLIFITLSTPLPLSTVLILCIDLGTDMVPAISMAWEAAEADIMHRPARNSKVDRLVTRKLVTFAYLQIGVIQAAAGFFTWMVVLNDYGYPPQILLGLGTFDNWGKQVLYCQLEGGRFLNLAGQATNDVGLAAIANNYYFWDADETGTVTECSFASKNFVGALTEMSVDLNVQDVSTFVNSAGEAFTAEEAQSSANSVHALMEAGYVPFMPWNARMSPFWQGEWLAWPVTKDGVPGLGEGVDPTLAFQAQPTGSWIIDAAATATEDTAKGNSNANAAVLATLGSDKIFEQGTFVNSQSDATTGAAAVRAAIAANAITMPGSGSMSDAALVTAFSAKYGMNAVVDGTLTSNIASRMMQKEALHHAQCAFFVSIVVVQWADLMICKTRWLSLRQQGMRNPAMNFGLVFETILAGYICYLPGIGDALGTRPIRLLHWAPAIPFSVCIFWYDEARKKIMRSTSPEQLVGKQIVRDYGWMARQTYY